MQNSGRISYLDPSSTTSPEEALRRRTELAQLVIRGYNRKALANHFDVHVDTISNWTQRPDVAALIHTLGRQRTDRLIHRIDSEFESRLDKVKEMDLEDVIKLRKELAPHRIEVSDTAEETKALTELMQAQVWGELDDAVPEEPDEEPERVPSDSAGRPGTGG